MAAHLDRLIRIMARLRDPDGGCPWDVEQTFATIAPHTIEEAYEVADAIERGDMGALRDELGDLLLQAVFHAQMAHELGHFDFDDVARAISEKLVRRHPHVFGDEVVVDSQAQTRAWERHKAAERDARGAERARASVLDGVAIALPALVRALKLQDRAARVGFDWNAPEDVLDKIEEEIAELRHEMDGARAPRKTMRASRVRRATRKTARAPRVWRATRKTARAPRVSRVWRATRKTARAPHPRIKSGGQRATRKTMRASPMSSAISCSPAQTSPASLAWMRNRCSGAATPNSKGDSTPWNPWQPARAGGSRISGSRAWKRSGNRPRPTRKRLRGCKQLKNNGF